MGEGRIVPRARCEGYAEERGEGCFEDCTEEGREGDGVMKDIQERDRYSGGGEGEGV